MTVPQAIARSVDLGRTPATEKLRISVSLPYGNAEAMQQFVDSVSDPASPEYRRFLTPDEIGARFGLIPSKVQKVVDYLTSNGFKINLVAKNRLAILAEATVAQAETAFHTTLRNFKAVDSKELADPYFHAFTVAPSVPSDIAPLISDVSGLENYTRPQRRALMPPQTRVLYNTSTLYNAGKQGQGRTIGISNWDGFRLSLLSTFVNNSYFTLPTPSGGVGSNISVVTISGGSGSGAQQGECDLDIQMILSVAPLSNIVIYDGGQSDVIGVLTQESNDNRADIITESWGWQLPASMALSAHNLHLAMNAAGITYMAASGDDGTTLEPYSYPDYEPEVLVVGGTSVTTDSAGNRISETGWSLGGGGWSTNTATFNVLPSWQKGTGVPTNIPYRLVPDVALNADPNTGYYFYFGSATEATGFYLGGGTSAASPTFAASLAIAQQQLIANGGLTANSAGKYRMGRLQDLIYSFKGSSSVFNDITAGANGNLPNGTASKATAGWDYATGWGTVNFLGFVNNYPSSVTVSDLSVSPASVVGGTTSTGTVTISTAAPTSGTVVSLTSSDAGVTVPATVKVASGATTATFTVTTSGVSVSEDVTLTATIGSSQKTAVLTVTPASLSAISFNPTSVVGGSTSTGTVTLTGSAPSGGITVSLSSSDGSVTVPATATIAAGATSVTFTATTTTVAAQKTATITATNGSVTKTGTLTVTTLPSFGISFSAARIASNGTVTGTVTLGSVAPTGGAVVNLSSSRTTALTVPATVTVPAGSSSVTFTGQGKVTGSAITVTVTASRSGLTSQTATVMVLPPSVVSITTPLAIVTGGNPTTATVTLSLAAPTGGVVVTTTSSNTVVATVPANVTVLAGQTSATYTVTTIGVATKGYSALRANTSGNTAKSVQVSVAPSLLKTVTANPNPVKGGTTCTGTVTLNGTAPAAGYVVSLMSSQPSIITVPSSVKIPAGQTSTTFTITTKVVTSTKSGRVTASHSGSGSPSVAVSVTK